MLLTHQIEIKANNKQRTYFAKACGVARHAYNWGLEQWIKQYELGEKPTETALRRQYNAIKRAEFPWALEVTKVAAQQAIKNLGNAFSRFFKQQGKYPRFKKRGIRDSFRADNGPSQAGEDAVVIIGNKLKLPRIGWITLREPLRFKGRIKSVTISRRAQRWYAAINVECDTPPHQRKNHGSVGVDFGIKALATPSKGTPIVGPKAYEKLLRRLQRLSRQLARKQKNSKNFIKLKNKIATLHARIRNIRNDEAHKFTTELVLNYSKIGIEDLNVKGMMQNRKLSRRIADCGFHELRRQIEYKSKWYGAEVIVVDRFFPSSKMCSACGVINQELTLSDRNWSCRCGAAHDRDLNAAINIENYINTVSLTEIHACGVEGSGIMAH